MYESLCGHMSSFFLDRVLIVELLDEMVSLCVTFQEIVKLFQSVIPFHILISFSVSLNQHLVFTVFLIMAVLVCVKWYFIVILVCISLQANDFEHLFMHLLENF